MLKSIILLITYYTRIPIPYRWQFKDEDLKRGIPFFILPGMIVGFMLYLSSLLISGANSTFYSVIIIFIYLIVAGALHLDGLADSCDALYSARDKKRMLEIMKDNNIGAFGVIGLIVVFLLYTSTIWVVEPINLFLFPIVGKASINLSASISKYAREDNGMGKTFINESKLLHGIAPIIIVGGLCYILNGYKPVIALAVTMLFCILKTKWIHKKIGGATGDTLGFIGELSQVLFLAAIYILNLYI